MHNTVHRAPATALPKRLQHVREVIPAAVVLLCEGCNLPAADRDRLCRMCREEMDRTYAEVVT